MGSRPGSWVLVLAGLIGLSASALAQGPAVWITLTGLDQVGPDCVARFRLDNHLGSEARLHAGIRLAPGHQTPLASTIDIDGLPADASVVRKARIEHQACAAVTSLVIEFSCEAVGAYGCGAYGFSDLPSASVSIVYPPVNDPSGLLDKPSG